MASLSACRLLRPPCKVGALTCRDLSEHTSNLCKVSFQSLRNAGCLSKTCPTKPGSVSKSFLAPRTCPASLTRFGRHSSWSVQASTQIQDPVEIVVDNKDHPFHLDLAVLLAGFAFESYNDVEEGIRQLSSCGTEGVFLDEHWVKELFSGQLKITLESVSNLPALDLTGTSDPYVTFSVGGSYARSKTTWKSLAPEWNADFNILVDGDMSQLELKVEVWDDNVVEANILIARGSVALAHLKNGTEKALEIDLDLNPEATSSKYSSKVSEYSSKIPLSKLPILKAKDVVSSAPTTLAPKLKMKLRYEPVTNDTALERTRKEKEEESEAKDKAEMVKRVAEALELQGKLSEALELKNKARAALPTVGLWGSNGEKTGDDETAEAVRNTSSKILQKLSDVKKKANRGLTNDSKGALDGDEVAPKPVVEVPWTKQFGPLWNSPKVQEKVLEETVAAQQEALPNAFKDAGSAIEAWTGLTEALGRPGYLASEFDKVVFLDHGGSDTQASIWRDPARRRIVVAFRGTEQTKWKDLVTDVNLMPGKFVIDGQEVKLEGENSSEVLLHNGFKKAYESIRGRIRTLVQELSKEPETGDGSKQDGSGQKWSVLVTGHSLGGALATLFAVELAVTNDKDASNIEHVTMYNYGSPRVGNQGFAEFYNKHVPDTWRLLNRDDIVPTVPRMLGYCHVGNALVLGDKPGSPVAGAVSSEESSEAQETELETEIMGEVKAKDFLPQLLRGKKDLLKKVAEKELATIYTLTDGSALAQHMEDFYYNALHKMVEMHLGKGTDTPKPQAART